AMSEVAQNSITYTVPRSKVVTGAPRSHASTSRNGAGLPTATGLILSRPIATGCSSTESEKSFAQGSSSSSSGGGGEGGTSSRGGCGGTVGGEEQAAP